MAPYRGFANARSRCLRSGVWFHRAGHDNAMDFLRRCRRPTIKLSKLVSVGKTSALLDHARDEWLGNITASADGLHLAFNQQTFEANVWLLEEF